MVERNPSRPWTAEEDKLLIQAVELHGEQEKWKSIAESIPGRTNKACRKARVLFHGPPFRWLHSLSPSIKKSAWTAAEDSQLVELFQLHGPKWSAIAREIPGRTDDACSKRYREALDPNLRKDDWTLPEDRRLLSLFIERNGKWGQIGQELRRSGLACRNRHRMLVNKAMRTYNAFRHMPGGQLPSHSPPDGSPSAADLAALEEQSNFDWTAGGDLLVMTGPSSPWSYPITDLPADQPDYHVEPIPPQPAPFHFASSSLSKALSAPAQVHRSLPTLVEHEELSPLPPDTMDDGYLTQDKQFSLLLGTSAENDPELAPLFRNIFWGPDGALYTHDETPADGLDDFNLETPSEAGASQDWEIPLNNFGPISNDPGPSIDYSYSVNQASQEFSLSTPFHHALSLSEGNTPESFSPIQMPNHLLQGATVTQSASPPNLERELRSGRRPLPYYNRRPDRTPGSTRLSSTLPATADPTLRPYACGRDSCWPENAERSTACFATSRELFDHSKNQHANEPVGPRPFRCGLAGCNKAWKSLNGIQYHLQVSTAHFQNAMSSSFSAKAQTAEGSEATSSLSASSTDTENDETRVYICPRPNCFKAYRQPSGLRYHLKHGHPSDGPAQLSHVPPALGRRLPKMTRKMRRKDALPDTSGAEESPAPAPQ